ncbi:MAG: hypothetical protein KME41_04635 [Candidatus Thiodiazotropha sp. (ex Lucina pensylvanica)]|nr:hypothetical protein [Candidatus Thiodiazotropha sp. (ex Lucina pensylvanica)]MBT3014641.1 hypothetical protein [Candidatus Thiodiazotropha taylori]MCG7862932.1 hypothetical protein [Candidatus Thiodiazotropha endolucinida]
MSLYNVRLNVEDVLLKVDEKPVRHGFYVNQIAESDNVEGAIEHAKRMILKRIKSDRRIISDEYNFIILIDNVEVMTEVNSHINVNQGFVWYKQESPNS